MLLDWGMDKKQVPDPTQEYHVEAWLIGPYVIKAVLNYDPLCRKPYYTRELREDAREHLGQLRRRPDARRRR
jgi:hypothetical protein